MLTLATLLSLTAPVGADPWPTITIPEVNAARQRTAPTRPPPGDVAERSRVLFDALNGGSIETAQRFFLPLEPFLAIKDMHGARGYHARLLREYARDIAAYRETLPRGQTLSFVRFVPSSTCVWMSVGREANRLPYYSCYGSRLVVRAGRREIALRVNVLIHWGDQWYVTHLDRIHR